MRNNENIKDNSISKNRDFKGVWIPRKLYLSGKFSPNEKFVLLEIYSLSKNRMCYASNKHFADFVGLKENTIQKMILSFERAGYIERFFEYKENSKEIKNRIIILKQKFLDDFINENTENEQETHGKKSIGGMEKNPPGDGKKVGDKYNNISNTYISNTLYAPTELHSFSQEEKESVPAGFHSSSRRCVQKTEKWIITKNHIMSCMEKYGYEKTSNKTQELVKIVKYYYQKYKEVFDNPHPRLSDEAMESMIGKYLDGFDHRGYGDDYDMYEALIEFHFETEYKQNIDWSIAHFMSGDIRQTLFNHNIL